MLAFQYKGKFFLFPHGLNEVLMASVNAKRSVPDHVSDIKEAFELIMEDMLKAQNRIILSL